MGKKKVKCGYIVPLCYRPGRCRVTRLNGSSGSLNRYSAGHDFYLPLRLSRTALVENYENMGVLKEKLFILKRNS